MAVFSGILFNEKTCTITHFNKKTEKMKCSREHKHSSTRWDIGLPYESKLLIFILIDHCYSHVFRGYEKWQLVENTVGIARI